MSCVLTKDRIRVVLWEGKVYVLCVEHNEFREVNLRKEALPT